MRKVGDKGKYPTMSQEDWDRFYSYSEKTMGQTTEQQKWRFAPTSSQLKDHIENAPEGFLTPKDHPDLKDIENRNDVDIYQMPGEQGDYLFIQKRPMTSKVQGAVQGV
jgi:hypothetical protein